VANEPVALVLAAARPGRAAIAALAGAVEEHHAAGAVRVYVAGPGAPLRDAVREARAAGPVVVGWSLSSANLGGAAEELRRLRNGPAGEALHVAGGPHPTADPLGTLRAGFDLAAVGEGEVTLPELLLRVARGEDPRGQGLAWLGAGRLERGLKASPVNLDSVPPFAVRQRRFGPIEITRGCVHACRFCQTTHLHGGEVRHRSPAVVERFVRAMAGEGLRDVRFLSPDALAYGSGDGSPNLPALEELLSRARSAAGRVGRLFLGSFPSEIRPEQVSTEALALLRRFVANDHLVLGAQSGSERMLAACHRGHGVEDVRRAVRLVLAAGFRAKVDLIFGLPGESPEDARKTRMLMRELSELGAEIHGHAFLPLPGTPWREAPPGALEEETRLEFERLASSGRARGQWRRQEALARVLADGWQGTPGGRKG